MDPSQLIPDPDALQVPWIIFQILLILTFVCHLLLMNLMLGGSLLSAGRALSGQEPPEFKTKLPILIALTINFGVPPLLFVQVLFGNLLYTSSILMGVFWISVIPVLILAYYTAYGAAKGRPAAARVWAVVSALLLLAISFVFSSNMTLMLKPETWPEWFGNPTGTILVLDDPMLYARWLHFIIASLAVTGLGTAGLAGWTKRADPDEPVPAVRAGLKLFAYATMVQVLIGVWFLLTLPREVMMAFMGQSMYATVLLALGILLALAVIFTAMRSKLNLTAVLLAVLVTVMVLMRDVVRGGYLAQYFSYANLPVNLSISPLILFVAILVAGLVCLGWMIKTALDPAQRKEA
ncbi:hypothetical protein JW859_08830 [bacterium]|nr:hypothetical protein [bacterium]